MNILITNMHSALNLGDDAIFDVTLSEIKRSIPDARITIATNDPISWQKYSPNVQILPSMVTWVKRWKNGNWKLNIGLVIYYSLMLLITIIAYKLHIKIHFGSIEIRQLLSAYYSCDILLVCGGGNIYATKKLSWGLIWEVLMFGFGVFIEKPVFLMPQSIGPIHGCLQTRILKFILNRVKKIYVRDQASADYLDALDIRNNYYVVPDLAFSLGKNKSMRRSQDGLIVGVTVINLDSALVPTVVQREYELTIEELIKQLNKQYNVSIKIIVQCFGPTIDQDDRIVSSRLFNNLKNEITSLEIINNIKDGRDVQTLVSNLDIMIGTRMHSGIFALSSCVPTILFKYQPKSLALMQMLGLEKFCVEMENLTPGLVYPVIEDLIKERLNIKEMLRVEMATIHKKQEEWFIKLIN